VWDTEFESRTAPPSSPPRGAPRALPCGAVAGRLEREPAGTWEVQGVLVGLLGDLAAATLKFAAITK